MSFNYAVIPAEPNLDVQVGPTKDDPKVYRHALVAWIVTFEMDEDGEISNAKARPVGGKFPFRP